MEQCDLDGRLYNPNKKYVEHVDGMVYEIYREEKIVTIHFKDLDGVIVEEIFPLNEVPVRCREEYAMIRLVTYDYSNDKHKEDYRCELEEIPQPLEPIHINGDDEDFDL